MSVNKADRRESKIEYENNFFKVYKDAIFLAEHSFGASEEVKAKREIFLRTSGTNVITTAYDIGKQIRLASSIYPKYISELEERRKIQEKAIGLCYDLLIKYQIIMDQLHIPGDKYTRHIKTVINEIRCLEKWKKSDSKKFKYLG